MEAEFKRWLLEHYTENTTNSYRSAIRTISRHYSENTRKEVDIYKIKDQNIINKIAQQYSLGGQLCRCWG